MYLCLYYTSHHDLIFWDTHQLEEGAGGDGMIAKLALRRLQSLDYVEYVDILDDDGSSGSFLVCRISLST